MSHYMIEETRPWGFFGDSIDEPRCNVLVTDGTEARSVGTLENRALALRVCQLLNAHGLYSVSDDALPGGGV